MTSTALRAAGLWLVATALAAAQTAPNGSGGGPDRSDAFFRKGEVPRLEIDLKAADLERLKEAPRTYHPADVRENEKTLYAAAVKLKGAAGSYRDWDDKPGLTLRFDRADKQGRFKDLRKVHLNNAAQDESYLHELLAGEMMRAAGVPAPRCTHARVRLNGRDVGLYVVKEGFDREFLKRWFKAPDGALYDGGFCQDVDAALERDAGSGPEDRADLKALLAAAQDPDVKRRWASLEQTVEIKPFVTFMAMELMLAHWDGYTANRNNYRLYFEPSTRKAHFLPHGMDQVWTEIDHPILDGPSGLVASAVMKNPTWRALFRKRVGELLPLFAPEKLHPRVDELHARLKPTLTAMGPDVARDYEGRARRLKDRIAARAKSLREQATQPEPKPLAFVAKKPVALGPPWRPASESEDAKLADVKLAGERAYLVQAGPGRSCIAGWRKTVLLPRGRYRFQASVQTEDVEPLEAPENRGAGVRISGGARPDGFLGSVFGKTSEIEFEVTEEARDVELIAELRAAKGRAWFRVDGFRLTKLDR
ncbi:MAG TPA: CotH kinase family protein [Planctomycetota bacterium]|nr:CotH kinase family protein [Planctomycetota bacterium]